MSRRLTGAPRPRTPFPPTFPAQTPSCQRADASCFFLRVTRAQNGSDLWSWMKWSLGKSSHDIGEGWHKGDRVRRLLTVPLGSQPHSPFPRHGPLTRIPNVHTSARSSRTSKSLHAVLEPVALG